MMIPENVPVRLLSAQLEELEYGKLYEAYSSRGRKSAAKPRVLFKVLVYGYLCGIYSSRILEEACQYRIDFRRLLEDRKAPDHSTLARFRTGRCKEAVEDLFYQFVRKLEEAGETDHKAVFVDRTKLESRGGRYTFVWRKRVEKQLVRVTERMCFIKPTNCDQKSTKKFQKQVGRIENIAYDPEKELVLQKTFWWRAPLPCSKMTLDSAAF